ncbi:MAG: YidC/Oxa1 family membrane protein insertase, partial [Clostridia bacterium]|nr:YidC/Oxa1 family membrane protein insertase [Clostridia bacterium]
YQQNGYNPMSGCLPLILQLAIVIFIWQAIMYPLLYVAKLDKATVSAVQAYITAPEIYETKVDADGLTDGRDGKVNGRGITLSKRYPQIDLMRYVIQESDAMGGKDAFLAGFRAFIEDPDLPDYMTEIYAQSSSAYSYFADFVTVDSANEDPSKLYFRITTTKKNVDTVTRYTVNGSDALVADLDFGFANMPNFDLFGLKNFLAEIPTVSMLWTFPYTVSTLLLLVPLFNFLASFFSLRLTRKLSYQPMQDAQQAGGCSPKLMDWIMPLFTLYIAFEVPAAIGIYWLFNNFLGIGQQVLLAKIMPMPTFTEEDFKNAEKAESARQAKAPKPVEGKSNEKSLHTIDADDNEEYAVLPEYKSYYDMTPAERDAAKHANDPKPEGNKRIGKFSIKSNKKD